MAAQVGEVGAKEFGRKWEMVLEGSFFTGICDGHHRSGGVCEL